MHNFRIQDGRQSAILDPIFTTIRLVRDFMVIHIISGFEDDRTKNVDCRALTRNFRIQDGCQSAILDPIFTNIELVRDFMVIHNISGFEDDWTKIADSRALTRKPDAQTDERTDARQTTTKTRGYSMP